MHDEAQDFKSDIARLIQEISAAATRDEARDIFELNDWLFITMTPKEREFYYAEIENIIREKTS